MSLDQLEDARATITVKQTGKNKAGEPKPDLQFSVRGLNTLDVTWLVQHYLPQIEVAVTKTLAEAKRTGKPPDPLSVLISMVPAVPTVFAEVVSRMSGEKLVNVQKLKLGYIVLAVSEILKLTVEEAGDLGNIVADLVATVQAALPGSDMEKLATLTRNQKAIAEALAG